MQRYFAEPYRFVPPYRGNLWCRLFSLIAPTYVRRRLHVRRWQFLTLSPPVQAPVLGSTDETNAFTTYKLDDTLHGAPEANPFVRPGDIISVPQADQVFVIGNVIKPSAIPLKEPLTVSKARAMARRAGRGRKRTGAANLPLPSKPSIGCAKPCHNVCATTCCSLREQRRAQVALAEVRQHDDDELTGVLGPLRHLYGDVRRRAAADAAQ